MREKHSLGLNKSFTGGNPSIMQSLNTMVQSEYSQMQEQFGFTDSQLFEYMSKAQAVLNENFSS